MIGPNVQAQSFELVDDLCDRPDQHEGRFLEQRLIDPELLSGVGNLLIGAGADMHELHQCRALDLGPSIACRLGQPPRPIPNRFDREASGCGLATVAVSQPRELEDVGMPGCDPHDTLAMTADQEGDMFLKTCFFVKDP